MYEKLNRHFQITLVLTANKINQPVSCTPLCDFFFPIDVFDFVLKATKISVIHNDYPILVKISLGLEV